MITRAGDHESVGRLKAFAYVVADKAAVYRAVIGEYASPPSADSSSTPLPEPRTKRWQPLRCGLINLYRFDHEEFRFEQGRLLLRGNNGTGKSRILALQLPFLLDGEVLPSRLEPDRDPAKHIEWNLLLGRYEDRLGYTWLEFGRREPDGSSRFLTLGCGLRAVRGRGSVAKWLFTSGRRVGRDLHLQTETGHALTQDRLVEALGSEGRVYGSAAQYRQAVDRELFSLGEHRYEALVNLLIQLRQPQLSRRLDEQKLSGALSEALAPLASHVIADVAESFRSLEDYRTDLESYRAARRGTEVFLREYQVYGQIAARRRAEDVRKTHSDYEAAQRALREGEAEVARLTDRQAEAVARHQEATLAEQEAAVRVATLQSSPEMRAAQSLDEAAQRARERADEQAAAEKDALQATEALGHAQVRAEEAAEKTSEALAALRAASEQALAAAHLAGMAATHRALQSEIEPYADTNAAAHRRAEEKLHRAVEDHLRGVRHVRTLQDAVDRALAASNQARQSLARATDEQEESIARQRDAHAAIQEATDRMATAFRQWSDDAEELNPYLPDDLEERLIQWCETAAGRCPLAEAVQAAAGRAAEDLAERKAASRQRLDDCQALLEETRAARDRALSGGHSPPPAHYTQSPEARDARPGGPLWLLCDFSSDASPAARAGVEAALEAAHLLDAWITPDGRLLAPEDHDAVLIAGTSPLAPEDRHLGMILTPAVDATGQLPGSVAPETVAAVLRHVGLGEGAGAVWVGDNGRFQAGPLHGSWAKPEAEHVGPAAREMRRRRRLAELDSRLTELARQRDAILAELEQWSTRQAAVQTRRTAAPASDDVVQAHAHLAAAVTAVHRARERVAEAEAHAVECRLRLEQTREKCLSDASDLGLTERLTDLPALEDAIHDYRRLLAGFWPRLAHLISARTAEQAAMERVAAAAENERHVRQRLLDARIRSVEAESRRRELQAAIGATAQEVMARLQEARDGLQRLHEQREEAAKRDSELETARALARKDVEGLEEKLAEHLQRRAVAIDGIKRFAGTKLLACWTRANAW